MQDSTRPCGFPDKRADSGYRGGCRCDRCRSGHSAAQRRSRMRAAGSLVVLCECGEPLPPKNSRFCSKACRRTIPYVPVERRTFTCALDSCHNLCSSSHREQRFCSDSCSQTAKRARKRGGRHSVNVHPHWVTSQPTLGPSLESWPMFVPTKVPATFDRPCTACGEMMLDAATSRKRCAECARTHNIERSMALYETAYNTGKVKQAMHWRYELVNYLRERDGDKCALCSTGMAFGVSTGPRGESDQGATVDHILPRSLDGSNDLANLQLAHWACNRAKSNRGAPEQLRLVG